MTQYYFDSVAGLDANSGLTTLAPKQTISALVGLIAAGNTLSMLRGSVWSGGSGFVLDIIGQNPVSTCTINDYGGAANPPILDAITYDNSAVGWTSVGSGNWTKAVADNITRVVFGGSTAALSIGGLAWATSSATDSVHQWWWNAGTLYIWTGSNSVSPPVFYGGLGYVGTTMNAAIRVRDSKNILLQRLQVMGGGNGGIIFYAAGQDTTDIQGDDLVAMYSNSPGFSFTGDGTFANKRITLNRPIYDTKSNSTENIGAGGGTSRWTRSDGYWCTSNYDVITINDPTCTGARHSGIDVYDQPGQVPGSLTITARPAYGLFDNSLVEYGRAIGHSGSIASQNTIISGIRSVGQVTRSQFSGTCKISGCSWKSMRWDNIVDGFESSQAVWFQSWDLAPGNSFMVDVLFQNNLIENPISAAMVFRNGTVTANSFNTNTIRILNNTIVDVTYYHDARRTENGSVLTFQGESFGAGGNVPAQIIKNNNLISPSSGVSQVMWNGSSYAINAAPGWAGNLENVEGYVYRAGGDYHPTALGGLKYAGILGYASALDSAGLLFNNPPSIAPTEFVVVVVPALNVIHKVPQVFHPDDQEHRRQIAQCLNGVMQGQTNNTVTVTLTANAATTTVTDARIGSTSILLPMPTTANAVAANGSLYVTGVGKQTAVLNHANNAQTDRTFIFAIVG